MIVKGWIYLSVLITIGWGHYALTPWCIYNVWLLVYVHTARHSAQFWFIEATEVHVYSVIYKFMSGGSQQNLWADDNEDEDKRDTFLIMGFCASATFMLMWNRSQEWWDSDTMGFTDRITSKISEFQGVPLATFFPVSLQSVTARLLTTQTEVVLNRKNPDLYLI